MPRAVPPPIHRRLVRDFGPKDPWARLLLFAINSRFDRDNGECFAGQETIAKDTCMGVSTIRAKTALVAREGWLALYPRGGNGKRWKSYIYRASVPDWIDLSAIKVKDTDAESLAQAYEATNGTIDPSANAGTLYPQKGQKRTPPPAAGGPSSAKPAPKRKAPPADEHKDRQLTAEAPPADGNKHRQPLRGKFFSESSSLSNLKQARLAPSARVQEHEQEPKSQEADSPAERVAQLTAAKALKALEARGSATRQEGPDLGERIRKLRTAMPSMTPEEIAKAMRTDTTTVLDAMRATA